jgi:hypothetical protein
VRYSGAGGEGVVALAALIGTRLSDGARRAADRSAAHQPEAGSGAASHLPVQHLLRLVLTSGNSWYWVDLALGWASELPLDPDVRHLVQALVLDHTVPQPTRHRAKRLYYTGKA